MVMPERRGHGDFLCLCTLAGPWRGCGVRVGLTPLEIDAGKCRGISNGARRGESVIVAKKIDVHVNAIGVSRGRCQKV